VERLPDNSVVEARVRTVKLSGHGGKGDNLFSPFVEVKHRTLQATSQPTSQDGGEITEPLEDEVVKKSHFTLTNNQYSLILVLLVLSVTVFLTVIIGNWLT